jgi:GTPase SAR1 family protein
LNNIVIILVGNKSDLGTSSLVTKKLGYSVGTRVSSVYPWKRVSREQLVVCETSALDTSNVEDTFQTVQTTYMDRVQQHGEYTRWWERSWKLEEHYGYTYELLSTSGSGGRDVANIHDVYVRVLDQTP